MYPKTSKPQEGSTCKDSLSKCFMTTNLYREAFASEVFPLKFLHIDRTLYSAEISIQNTIFNLYIMIKKGEEIF